jgi:hypothetical protein
MELLDVKSITSEKPYIQILKRLQESNKKVAGPKMM